MAVKRYLGGFIDERQAWLAGYDLNRLTLQGNEIRETCFQYNYGNWWAVGVEVETNATDETHEQIKAILARGAVDLQGKGFDDVIRNGTIGRLGFFGDGWLGFNAWIRVARPDLFRLERRNGKNFTNEEAKLHPQD